MAQLSIVGSGAKIIILRGNVWAETAPMRRSLSEFVRIVNNTIPLAMIRCVVFIEHAVAVTALKEFEMTMAYQKAIDIAVPALLKQGARSMDYTVIGLCAYRGFDGKKCAVGWLMTDENYDPAFDGCDGRGWNDVLETIGVPIEHQLDNGFYNKFQKCHDKARGGFIPEFTARVKKLCREYNLEYPA
jgi:hypothetical protein